MKINKFKIGDPVLYSSSNSYKGEVGCIHENRLYLKNNDITGDECKQHGTNWVCQVKDDGNVGGSKRNGNLILNTSRRNMETKTIKPITPNIMSNIVTFAKNLTLSKDEKLLRKQGLKDECGNYSDDANRIVMAKLCQDNELHLVEIAQQKETEDKKK